MTSLPPFRIGVWQDETPAGGIDVALEHIRAAVQDAAANTVDLLVFPECFLTGYYRDAADVPRIAQALNGGHLALLQSLSDDSGVAFILGTYQAVEQGVANAALVFLPEQPAPLSYHKRALFGEWEKSAFVPGSEPLKFEFRGRNCAVLICFDVEFPELVRELAGAGVDTVLVPTALMVPEDDAADFLVPARAIENGITIAYANRIGQEGHLTFIGKSQICGPVSATRKVAASEFRGLMTAGAHEAPPLIDYVEESRVQGLRGAGAVQDAEGI